MLISSALDYREHARKRLPRFLFDYLDGGAGTESTMARNVADLGNVTLRQRVLRDTSNVDLSSRIFGQTLSLPLILGPVGMAGMYARRGEVQAARAAAGKGVAFCLSTVSVCPLEEVLKHVQSQVWLQLYVLRDRGFMRDLLQKAQNLGVSTLVFTVDMPVPGSRHRDIHSGLSGPYAPFRRLLQAMGRGRWSWDVGLWGRPHTLGNLAPVLGEASGLKDFIGWLGANFDPAIQWRDLEWIRDMWRGSLVIKGILEPEDARNAVSLGADGIVVSNHGGRQLDGAPSSAHALPPIVDAVADRLTILADSGIRSGLDVVRMLALGAKAVLLGRAWVYALAARGEAGVSHMIEIMEKEMRVAMALTGARDLKSVNRSILADDNFRSP